MNVLSIDFGRQRVGYAYGNIEAGIAFPGGVFVNSPELVRQIGRVVKERRIDLILVGMPYRSDGSVGEIHQEIDQLVDDLLVLGPEVRTIDERFTSKIADQKVSDLGLKRSDRQEARDDLAAQALLEAWFDSQGG